ncbi:hypothetical protein LJC27_07775 [Christensenellaceae bacterium OttesenSCG-928-M15]|nr:hypothetical protein [Christensenellaceae bacterium OttesenSCG-928-M15]
MWKNFSELKTQLKAGEPKTLVVAAAHDPYILQAVFHAADVLPMRYVLLGDKWRMMDVARNIGRELDEAAIMHIEEDKQCLRAALEIMRAGKGHALMRGAIGRARFLSLMQSCADAEHTLSSLALLEIPAYQKPIAVTDVTIYETPSLPEKTAILQNAARLYRRAGENPPKIAAVVPFEDEPGHTAITNDVVALASLNDKGAFGECLLDGPMPLEAALNMDAAAGEGVYGEVSGDADILLMPGLAAGAFFCKALSFFGGAKLAGCVLGAAGPIVWPTKSASLEEALRSIVLCLGTA